MREITLTRLMGRFTLAVLGGVLPLLGLALLVAPLVPVGRELALMSNKGAGVAFTGGGGAGDGWNVYLMDSARHLAVPLTSGTPGVPLSHRYPAWSPDGTKLAYHANPDGNWDLYVQDVTTRAVTRLTDHPADDAMPVWSPDGTRLAFHTSRDGNWDLYVYDLATGTQRRLTFYSGEDTFPVWSPDGSKIVYVSDRNINYDLFVRVGLDGSPPDSNVFSLRQLTDTPDYDDWAPAWSPDGTKLAFVSDRRGSYDIFVVGVDQPSRAPDGTLRIGGDAQPVTGTQAYEWSPIWADDDTITFVSNISGIEQLYSLKYTGVEVDYADFRQLTFGVWDSWAPDWRPGGR